MHELHRKALRAVAHFILFILATLLKKVQAGLHEKKAASQLNVKLTQKQKCSTN